MFQLWFQRWWKKLLLIGLLLCAVGLIAFFFINSHITSFAEEFILTQEDIVDFPTVDCILILGCGVGNGQPSPMLKDRLNTGLQLYHAGVSDRLLMSGDHGKSTYDEVNVMKQYATEAGVPSEAVFMDHAGFSTYDSMYRAGEIFQAQRVLIVTQAYHLPRAIYLAKALGLDAYGVAAESPNYAGQGYRDFREACARVKDFAFSFLRPKPSYLGESIPVSGNGNLTNDLP